MPGEPNDAAPVVIFCSVNRPEMLHESILCATRQTVPCRIIVSVPGHIHLAEATRALPTITVVIGKLGSTAQRNTALRAIKGTPEAIVFLDDDMEVEEHYVEQLVRTFREHPEVALANGTNLAHGLYPPGSLDRETARTLIRERLAMNLPVQDVTPAKTAYGCLMAVRGALLGKVGFDERLPLYGFMEDFDFDLQCRAHGAVVQNPNALGVHIEVASGRTGEKRRGYSEVVNPIYIWSKKTGARFYRVLLGSIRRTFKNVVRAVKGQGHERLIGNLLGWANVATLRPKPERILEI
jgi:GT2 family glycosyltransferase